MSRALFEKEMTIEELQQALIDAQLVDPDAIECPDEYDEGETLAAIDELFAKIKPFTL
jgi:hypothetical protein